MDGVSPKWLSSKRCVVCGIGVRQDTSVASGGSPAAQTGWRLRPYLYVESESEAEKALCGKLETYLIRFCLVIQVMRGICGEADMNEIDEESADRAIRLTEYFRAMESRIAPEMEVGVLDQRHTELLSLLPSSFTTSEAVGIGKRIGLSESTVKRFLREGAREFIRKEAHGHYCKI